jgi:general stress protein CsbA
LHLDYLAAFFLPGLLVVLFTRVTYSRILGLVLTVGLIAGSVYKGYTDSFPLIVVDALSLTAGFWYSSKISKRAKQRT